MKSKLSPLVLASVSAGMISLAATPSSIAADLVISNKTDIVGCEYSQAAFDTNGRLTLTLVNPTCLGGEPPVSPPPVSPPPVSPPPVSPPPVSPPPVSENPACIPVDVSVVTVKEHNWKSVIAANARSPIQLPKNQIYTLKLTGSVGKGGYGVTSTDDGVGSVAVRKAVISECPGSMIPASGNPDLNNGYNACVSVGAANTNIKWSHSKDTPRGSTYCRLDPTKQYYINIQNESNADGSSTCTTASCMFLMSYSMSKEL